MAILSLVVAAIYSTWMVVVRGSRVGLEAAAAVQRSRLAIHTLEQGLTAARSFAGTIEHYAFTGENGSDARLSFVARLPKSFPRSGKFGDFDMRRVIFSIESGEDYGRQLVLRQHPVLMEMDIDEEEHPVVLARNVQDFEMEFWDMRSQEWLDEWTETNQMPLMVRFTLRLGGNATGASPALEESIRTVSLAAITVQPVWQMPPVQRTGPGGKQPGAGNTQGGSTAPEVTTPPPGTITVAPGGGP